LFKECRSLTHGGHHFTLDECPAGQLINIRSTELGFKQKCSQKNVACKRSTQHPDIMRCNGQRTCSFGPNVLMYPQGNVQKLCRQHRHANFILIRYQCIYGIILLLAVASLRQFFKYFSLLFLRMYTSVP